MVDDIVKIAGLLEIERLEDETAALINETIRNGIKKLGIDKDAADVSKDLALTDQLEPTVIHEWLHGEKPEGG